LSKSILNAAELIAESLGSDGVEMVYPDENDEYEQHPFDVA
jgi:hypothetical protein